jgi:hypothetical protein
LIRETASVRKLIADRTEQQNSAAGNYEDCTTDGDVTEIEFNPTFRGSFLNNMNYIVTETIPKYERNIK